MISLALRSLLARRGRTLLSIVGVALGVGVLYASLATDAGITSSIDRTVRDLVGRADLRIEAFGPVGLSPDSLAAIEDAPGVVVAAPALERRTYLSPGADQTAAAAPVTALGIDPAREARVRDLVVVAGEALPKDDIARALVTQTLAASDGLQVGGQVTFLGPDGPVDLEIAGILAGDGPIVGTAGRTVVLPLVAMQRTLRRRDRLARRRDRGRGRHAGRGRRRDRARPDQPAVRPVVTGRRGHVAAQLHGGLPGDDRADRRRRPVRGRVPDLQHALDDGHRANPRAGAAARGRRHPRPARLVRPDPGDRARDPGGAARDRGRVRAGRADGAGAPDGAVDPVRARGSAAGFGLHPRGHRPRRDDRRRDRARSPRRLDLARGGAPRAAGPGRIPPRPPPLARRGVRRGRGGRAGRLAPRCGPRRPRSFGARLPRPARRRARRAVGPGRAGATGRAAVPRRVPGGGASGPRRDRP